MAFNDCKNFSNSGMKTVSDENQSTKSIDELLQMFDDIYDMVAWQYPQEASYATKSNPLEFDPVHWLRSQPQDLSLSEPSLHHSEDADLARPCASPRSWNSDEAVSCSGSEEQAPMPASLEELRPQSPEFSPDLDQILSQLLPNSEGETAMEAASEAPQLASLEVPLEPMDLVEHQPSPYGKTQAPMDSQHQIELQQLQSWNCYEQSQQFSVHPANQSQTSVFLAPETPNYVQAPSPCYPTSYQTPNPSQASSSSGLHTPMQPQQLYCDQPQQSQYLMPPLPNSDTLLMPPPNSTLPLRSQLRVIRPVMKKRQTEKTNTASRAKPYTTKAPATRGNTKASAPSQSAVQPVQSVRRVQATAPSLSARAAQIPINPIQQQHPINSNAHIMRPLQIPRAFNLRTNGWYFPNVPQEGDFIRIVTNVPQGPMYPTVQLMSTRTNTTPILLYEGINRTFEVPIFMEDPNGMRLPVDAQFVIPPTVTQVPITLTYTFANNFTASLKKYLS